MIEEQFLILREWFRFVMEQYPCLTPVLLIYFRCAPEKALERMLARGRAEENQWLWSICKRYTNSMKHGSTSQMHSINSVLFPCWNQQTFGANRKKVQYIDQPPLARCMVVGCKCSFSTQTKILTGLGTNETDA